ncbi:(Lyso)-N-acylphosphatidylethanolamine lipase-like isoform X2 [Daphnia pulex]|uniref:(Lyso)-N-acylphosphatidylethanolamine lipase-like isoform X2 n=1 Tax=Daphnia pulex TaxID=6669 RepID=UPI001EDCFEE0|nr:(Lyso)-N-acylphosphatidylethanolamine lipase-like isoform X2 [Daphnia pulex]
MSDYVLKGAEKTLIDSIKFPHEIRLVNIGKCIGDTTEDNFILTLIVNKNGGKSPLVLLHGFTSGIGLWCLNFDALAEDRPVYAMDLLGFGSSSRPHFNTDANVAEGEMVKFVEEWRKGVKLDQDFILLGHSMGAFVAAAYALRHPDKVSHLILADPWGFSTRPSNAQGIVFNMLQRFPKLNPLKFMRSSGPTLGPQLVKCVRLDIGHLYGKFFPVSVIAQYIYDCNAKPPTGEHCFYSMMDSFRWAKHPMRDRICKLKQSIPLTFIYGELSWVDKSPGEFIKEKRVGCLVYIHIIKGARHHVYAEKPEKFHEHVLDACQKADN